MCLPPERKTKMIIKGGATIMKSFNKIIATVLIVLILILSLSSCSKEATNSFLNEVTLGVWDRILLDEKTHNVVEYVDENTAKYQ